MPSTAAKAVRLVAALAAAFAFTFPLLTTLHTWVPGTKQRALYEPRPSDRLLPFEIDGKAQLLVQDLPALTSHQRILLMIATFRTEPRLIGADLTFAGGACAYHAADNSEIVDNYLLAFDRDGDCSAPDGPGEATLEFRLQNRARLALVGFVSASPPPRDALVLTSPALADAHVAPILVGDLVMVDPANGATRRDLLGYMWDVRPDPAWLERAITICGALIGCAVLVWPGGPAPRFGAARQTVAALLAAFALSTSYAVLCPPFEVADEPSHFLVLTTYVGRGDLAEPSKLWARRNMIEEIRFHPSRPFSPLDRGGVGKKSTEISVPTRDLYGAVRGLWHLLGPLVRGQDLPRIFLTARLFHAALFACAAALFVLLVRTLTGSAAAVSAALPLVLVPTLPQFGMHVSNYAPLLAAYTVIGAGIVIAFWDGPRSWAAGPVLGFGLGAAISISRSSLPLLPMIACVLAARALLGDRTPGRWKTWAFWGGFTLLLAGMLMVIRTPYTVELDNYGGLVSPPATAFTVLLRRPLFLLPFGAAGLMSELLLTRVRGRLRDTSSDAAVRWIALGAAAAVFVVCAASLLVSYPELPIYPPPHRPRAGEYIRQAVLASVTFLRFGRPDWLTSITFFAGFGWLDMIPPIRLVSLIAGTSGMMLVLLLIWVARTRSTRALLWLGCAAAGFVASAAAYALSIIRAVPSDLHGRFLIGLYLCTLMICWTGAGRTVESSPSGRYAVATAALAAVIAVNVYSLRLILLRFFS